MAHRRSQQPIRKLVKSPTRPHCCCVPVTLNNCSSSTTCVVSVTWGFFHGKAKLLPPRTLQLTTPPVALWHISLPNGGVHCTNVPAKICIMLPHVVTATTRYQVCVNDAYDTYGRGRFSSSTGSRFCPGVQTGPCSECAPLLIDLFRGALQ